MGQLTMPTLPLIWQSHASNEMTFGVEFCTFPSTVLPLRAPKERLVRHLQRDSNVLGGRRFRGRWDDMGQSSGGIAAKA